MANLLKQHRPIYDDSMGKKHNKSNSSGYNNESLELQQKIAVHKFGGSSLANKNRLFNVVNIIQKYSEAEDFIVVSANGNVTDWLVDFSQGDLDAIDKISNYYFDLAFDSLTKPTEFLTWFKKNLIELKIVSYSSEDVLAHGEIWSAKLLVALLNEQNTPALFIDARDLLRTSSVENFELFETDYFDQGLEKVLYGNFKKRIIITGYIANNLTDKTITLGRNGSDYSASLLANLSRARSVTLWTDVSGIYEADPGLIKHAQAIQYLTFDEAQALASVGTNVLHHKTIAPLLKFRIPLYVRSSLAPLNTGTCIGLDNIQPTKNRYSIKSIALKQKLINVTISLNLNITPERLQKSLIDAHLVAIQTDYNFQNNKLSLLIEHGLLNQAQKVFRSLKLHYQVETKHCSAIAIVGEQINQQQDFIKQLSKSTSIQFQCQLIQNECENIILYVSRQGCHIEFLEHVYQYCQSYMNNKCNLHSNSMSNKEVGNTDNRQKRLIKKKANNITHFQLAIEESN